LANTAAQFKGSLLENRLAIALHLSPFLEQHQGA